MAIMEKKIYLVFLSCYLILTSTPVLAEKGFSLTLYGAQLTTDSLGDALIGQSYFEDSYLVSLAISKKIASYEEYVDFEIEGQAVKHFGDQDHWEFNGLPFVIRWYPMPWDKYIDTNMAFGAGLSYALRTPALEARDIPDSPKLLGYLLFELTFLPHRTSPWRVVLRLHHRSGANGLFGKDKRDGSNALGFGVRYNF